MLFGLFKKENKEKNLLSGMTIPTHIAVIMDGNGRWAKRRGLPRSAGHIRGSDILEEIVTYCRDIGIKYFTAYAFSTENWTRPKDEIDGIMKLLIKYNNKVLNERDIDKDRVKYIFIGDRSKMSDELQYSMKMVEEKTAHCKGITFNIAVNYGGRDEIINAAKLLADKVLKGEMEIDDIDNDSFCKEMYTDCPDPDMIIRPSGEQRLSNFLLWQSAYSELWFSDVLWPDFTTNDIDRAVVNFNNRDRRYGGIK